MIAIHNRFLKCLNVIKDIKRIEGNVKMLCIYSTVISCFLETALVTESCPLKKKKKATERRQFRKIKMI